MAFQSNEQLFAHLINTNNINHLKGIMYASGHPEYIGILDICIASVGRDPEKIKIMMKLLLDGRTSRRASPDDTKSSEA